MASLFVFHDGLLGTLKVNRVHREEEGKSAELAPLLQTGTRPLVSGRYRDLVCYGA